MIKTKMLVELSLPYNRSNYKPLLDLAKNQFYSKKDKNYKWIFLVSDIPKVLAVVGKPMVFSKEDAQMVLRYVDKDKKHILLKRKQGAGFIDVKDHPKRPGFFIVTTVRERQPQNTIVSYETVRALWRVIHKQPKDRKVLTHTVAENYCNELGIVSFNIGKGGRFNWKYMMGSRKVYLVFYACIKVLSYFGVINHVVEASKSGIIRKKDSWILQTNLP